MKIFLTLILLIFSFSVFAQTNTDGNSGETTMEEYKYITRGYAATVAKGMRVMKGYRFIEKKSYTARDNEQVERKITIRELWRDSIPHPVALMIETYRADTKGTAYFCIPTPNAYDSVWDAVRSDILRQADNNGLLLTLVTVLATSTSTYFSMIQ